MHSAKNNNLPDGTFIAEGNEAYLLFNKKMYLWTPAGYTKVKPFVSSGVSTLLTPASVVNAFRAGYVPQVKVD